MPLTDQIIILIFAMLALVVLVATKPNKTVWAKRKKRNARRSKRTARARKRASA